MKVVKQNKYKVGDKVKIIDKWVDGCGQNFDGEMNKWLGKVMTIKFVDTDNSYHMDEDINENCGCGWYWNDKCIEGKVVEEPEQLQNAIVDETHKTIIVAVKHLDYKMNAEKRIFYFKTNDGVKIGDYVYCDTCNGLMVCVVKEVYITLEEAFELKDLPNLQSLKECRTKLEV